MLQPILLIGDALAILAVIFIGLRFHESEVILAGRQIANFLPFLLAWFLVAGAVGILRSPGSTQWSKLGHLLLAGAFTAPLGSVVRGFVLSRPIMPIFVLVMFLALAIGLLIWRSIYISLVSKRLKFT